VVARGAVAAAVAASYGVGFMANAVYAVSRMWKRESTHGVAVEYLIWNIPSVVAWLLCRLLSAQARQVSTIGVLGGAWLLVAGLMIWGRTTALESPWPLALALVASTVFMGTYVPRGRAPQRM